MPADLRQTMRQRLLAERGAVVKEAGAVRLRVALAYPQTYHVGMSNLGLQTIYRLVNQRSDALCERVFLPDPADVSRHGYANAPLVFRGIPAARP